ncbi:MAG: hypothetical protein LBD85_03890 [Oscillospiraceae bacterium]|jgi:hypothetical protein|nr:hypothetical protein [Oscillospiraceae bacterium]
MLMFSGTFVVHYGSSGELYQTLGDFYQTLVELYETFVEIMFASAAAVSGL